MKMGLCVDSSHCFRGTLGLHVQGSRVVRKLTAVSVITIYRYEFTHCLL